MSDQSLAALVLLLVVAPFSLVMLVALVRGYKLTVVLERWKRSKGDDS